MRVVSLSPFRSMPAYFLNFPSSHRGHPDIDGFVEVFKESIEKMNINAFKNQLTTRQLVELLNTKYVAVLGYMVGGDIDGQMSKKVICELIESSSNQ